MKNLVNYHNVYNIRFLTCKSHKFNHINIHYFIWRNKKKLQIFIFLSIIHKIQPFMKKEINKKKMGYFPSFSILFFLQE